MNYDYNRRDSQRRPTGAASISIDLQLTLLNTWTQHQVGQYYQNIFLAHLDELPPAMVEEKIKKQIKHTMQRRTLHFSLQNLSNQRKRILLQLQQQLAIFLSDINEDQLAFACRQLRILRDVTLQIAEILIKMNQEFRCNDAEMHNKQLAEFAILIDGLQSSTNFVKNSILKNYIWFGEGFDPFFMHSYEQLHRQNFQNASQSVRELYSINISYVYRLMKAKSKLLDMRTAYQQPSQYHKKKIKQTTKIESLPTLHTSHFVDQIDPQFHQNKKPLKITPIQIIPIRERGSRTTIHPYTHDGRPQSSFTQEYSKPRLKSSKVRNFYDDIDSNRSLKSKPKKNKVYLPTQPNQRRQIPKRKYEFNRYDESDLSSSLYHPQKSFLIQDNYERQKDKSFLPHKNQKDIQTDRKQNDLQNIKNKMHFKHSLISQEQSNNISKIKNYNPIKGDTFQVTQAPSHSNRYDFNPQIKFNQTPYHAKESQKDGLIGGLDDESPIQKYNNRKGKFLRSKRSSMPNVINHKNHNDEKDQINQEIQTVQMRISEKKIASSMMSVPSHNIQNTKGRKPAKGSYMDDQILEDGDIIDERPVESLLQQRKLPLIREVSKEQASPLQKPTTSNSPKKDTMKINNKDANQEKKQIKMKIGKSTINQVLTLLKNSTILPEYKALFDLQKLVQWIKVSQTYLTQFWINGICTVIALCSPIPNIGIAIKLWAPIDKQVNQNLSMNLWAKYLQFIEKSTTAERIVYNGNGQQFKQLKNSGFIMKKQKLYQRTRQLPPKISNSQFKPFLEMELSTVNFAQNGKQNLLFSQEIQEFSQSNCHLIDFFGNINANMIPEPLKPLIKINERITNFNEVNKILTDEQFDQYQASDMKATNIKLLRFYLNSSIKSAFVAGQGFIKLTGNLHYQKDQQCLISVNTSKNNGFMYFSKNMSFELIHQKSKINSSTKVTFSVKMFTKKLYGRLIKFSSGCYGNFEINFAYEDEMQGRIKHNLKIDRCFGPEQFTIGIQIQKSHILCTIIGEDDFIY